MNAASARDLEPSEDRRPPPCWRSSWVIALAFGFAALLATACIRAGLESSEFLSKGQAAQANGRVLDAIAELRRASRWYFPGNPWSSRALAGLRAIAETHEQRNEYDIALRAWRSVRGAILSSRSVFVPQRELLALSNRRIAELMAYHQPRPRIDAEKPAQVLAREHEALLIQSQERPNPLFAFLALLGLFGFVAALTVAVDGRTPKRLAHLPPTRSRLLMLTGSAGSLAVFFMSLWLA